MELTSNRAVENAAIAWAGGLGVKKRFRGSACKEDARLLDSAPGTAGAVFERAPGNSVVRSSFSVYGDGMATWDDVRRLATALPEVEERQDRNEWRVRDKAFVFERPLRQSDLEALGEDAPADPILGAWVPDLVAKEALLADAPEVYFTTPHFDGYRMVLVRLDVIEPEELEELIVEAWLTRAPKRLARSYTEDHGLNAEPDPT